MMRDCCSLRGFSGVGMAVSVLHFSAVKFVVRLSTPIPHDRNYVGRSLVSICSRRGHEGLLCKFSAAFISVAIVAVTVVAFPWPAPSAGAATSDLGVPLGETSAQISYVRNTEGSDAVTDLAGGYYCSALPWQWAATRAGGDYSTSVVKGSSGAYATVGYGCQELNGSFNVRTAGTIEANFPWVEKDTINTCAGKIDSDGKLIVGD